MRIFTTPSLIDTSNPGTNRPIGTASHLALLVLLLTATSNSYAQIGFTKVGDPVFEIVGHATVSSPVSSGEFWNDLNDIFGPSDLVVEGVGVTPIEPVNMSIDEHVRRKVAASGRVNTDVFAVEEIFWDQNWTSLLSLSPTGTAATGASPQNSNGPIIPNDIYPLTHQFELYQNGSHVWTSPARSRSSLGSVGSQTLDDGTQIDFTEFSFGDYVFPIGWGAGRGHSLNSLVASYEHRVTLTDRNGNGWEYVVPIETVRHPTDIAGDLNYNGRFDGQDYDILKRNVEVAPAEPQGEFLRRLDLNGDSMVDVLDLTYWDEELLQLADGDANRDGLVNATDLNALAVNWRTVGGATWEQGDFTGDGNVGAADLNALALNWNRGVAAAASSPAAVPEPSGIALLLVGLCALARHARHSGRLPS
jgi:hypothetical protein